jgi:uncharacterized protein YfaP (DUF2135 family)
MRTAIFFAALTAGTVAGTLAGTIAVTTPALAQLDAPLNGWRPGDPDAPYTQAANYPASTPSLSENDSSAAQIRGKIESMKKPATVSAKDTATTTARLIVNGNAMPLRLDADGSFGRPYSFGAGSNSVEVRTGNDANASHLRSQFYQTAAGQPVPRMRIVLAWDTDNTDLDLHVVTPSGQHAWYGEKAITSGSLDIDVTTGYGPEIFSSPAPERGLYQVYINYYGGQDEGDGQIPAITTARVTIITDEGRPSEKRQEFTVPMRFPGELLLARQFVNP